jgi:hypothetical protein
MFVAETGFALFANDRAHANTSKLYNVVIYYTACRTGSRPRLNNSIITR